MSKNNEEYIQLPPLKKDTDGFVVQMIWEYIKMPDELQKSVYDDLIKFNQGATLQDLNIPDKYREISHESFSDFEMGMNKLIRTLILEASDVAAWVFAKKYISGWSLDRMLQEMPKAEQFIVVMDSLFEKHIKNKDDDISEMTM